MNPRSIPLCRPDISEKEIRAVADVLESGVLSMGTKVDEFEACMAELIGVSDAVAVNSGTSALHLCVRGMGLSEGDEVITTPFSFVASSNCLLYERVRPVFVDIDPRTYNMDPQKIEGAITGKTKAILAVDVFGVPCEWDEICDIARRKKLHVIEDSCEALGSSVKGKMAGSFGDCGVFGFYPNKQITTGEGGVITTNNQALAKSCRSMRNQGRGEGDALLLHERLGFNYRLSDIHAALGIVQLERLNEIREKRSRVASWYASQLEGSKGLSIPSYGEEGRVSWFVYVVRLNEDFDGLARNRIISILRKRGVACSPYFPAIHLQKVYKEEFGYQEGNFPVAEGVSDRTIALPFFGDMSQDDVGFVVASLQEVIGEVSKLGA